MPVVNIGTSPNDGTGDPLRSAFGKLNVAVEDLSAQLLSALTNAGKMYPNRQSAVDAGQSALVGALALIMTIEGDYLVFRRPFQNGDDPLFETSPYWGATFRLPRIQWVQSLINTLTTEVRDGRVWYVGGSESPSGLAVPSYADFVVTVHYGSRLFRQWRPVAAPTNGLETETLKQDAGNPVRWWLQVNDTLGRNGIEKGGSVILENVGGTGDAITADIPALLVNDGVRPTNVMHIAFIMPAANTGAATITLNGGEVVAQLRTEGNAQLPANYLPAGTLVTASKIGSVFRITSGAVSKADVDAKAPLNSPALTGTPTVPTPAPGTNSTQIANTAFVAAAINALIDSAPGALDTLNELAAALGNDPNFATTITNMIASVQAAMNAAEAGITDQLEGITTELASDYEAVDQDDVAWFGWDKDGRAILGWSSSGLRVRLDDWTVGQLSPGILSEVDGLEVDAATDEGAGVRVLERDEGDRALRVMRADGQDMIMSEEFTRREIQKAVDLGLLDPHGNALSTTAWQAISVNGQSLSVGGPWSGSAVTMAEFMARVDPTHALMLTGTMRGDNVPITTLDMPRSQGYNTSVPATGVAAANPSTSVVSAAAPLAYIVNAYRRDLGLPMVPIISQCHGISGIRIEDIDPDPNTGSGATTVWENMTYWYQQVVAQAAAQGKTLTVPWHDWVHGTSAAADPPGQYEAALWRYQRDMRNLLATVGAEGPALFIMSQPGGNADTSHPNNTWHVCDEMLAFCEAGGGVMATPEYAYQIADNNVHPDAYWTIQFQEVKGRAIAEVEAGRPWTIHRPKARITGSQIVLDFDSLRPGEYLVLHDPARYGGEGIDAYAGFEALGAAITGMQIRGRQVILDCDAAPTGVRYAMQKQDVTGFSGNMWTAHRGLLRTSDVWPSKLLPGVDLYRWVPSFTITF